MATRRSIAAVVSKVKLHESTSDFQYWQSQPFQRRLMTVEEIRQEYHRWKYDSQPLPNLRELVPFYPKVAADGDAVFITVL